MRIGFGGGIGSARARCVLCVLVSCGPMVRLLTCGGLPPENELACLGT